jgi:hypothetical protein
MKGDARGGLASLIRGVRFKDGGRGKGTHRPEKRIEKDPSTTWKSSISKVTGNEIKGGARRGLASSIRGVRSEGGGEVKKNPLR